MNEKDQYSTDDNTITIDYLGTGAQPALDTITIGGLDTITFDASAYTSNTSITSPCTITLPGYSSGINCHTTWTTTGTGYTIGSGNWSNQANVHINSDGIDIKEGGDIKVDGKSLKEFMLKMEQRMAILVPDPKKLEKFEALKKAYEHYKTLESLCFDEPEEEQK